MRPKRPQNACSRLRHARVAELEHGLESAIQDAVMRHNVRYELFIDGEFVKRYWGPGPHNLPAICTEENRDRWEMRCEGVIDEGTVEVNA